MRADGPWGIRKPVQPRPTPRRDPCSLRHRRRHRYYCLVMVMISRAWGAFGEVCDVRNSQTPGIQSRCILGANVPRYFVFMVQSELMREWVSVRQRSDESWHESNKELSSACAAFWDLRLGNGGGRCRHKRDVNARSQRKMLASRRRGPGGVRHLLREVCSLLYVVRCTKLSFWRVSASCRRAAYHAAALAVCIHPLPPSFLMSWITAATTRKQGRHYSVTGHQPACLPASLPASVTACRLRMVCRDGDEGVDTGTIYLLDKSL